MFTLLFRYLNFNLNTSSTMLVFTYQTISLTSVCLSSRRDQDQVPLCLLGPLRRAPGLRGSASRVSISGTCSSVWRTRDLPVTPISSTRAFSNRLDVKEGRRGGGGGDEVCGESNSSHRREIIRDSHKWRGGGQRLGTFQGLSDKQEPEIQ